MTDTPAKTKLDATLVRLARAREAYEALKLEYKADMDAFVAEKQRRKAHGVAERAEAHSRRAAERRAKKQAVPCDCCIVDGHPAEVCRYPNG